MPTIATVPCGDMVVRYEQDDATGDVRFMLLPAAAGSLPSRPTPGPRAPWVGTRERNRPRSRGACRRWASRTNHWCKCR